MMMMDAHFELSLIGLRSAAPIVVLTILATWVGNKQQLVARILLQREAKGDKHATCQRKMRQ